MRAATCCGASPCRSQLAGCSGASGRSLRRSSVLLAGGIGAAAWALAGIVVAGAAAASSAGGGGRSGQMQAQRLVRSGMDKFKAGDVEGSLLDFDAALDADAGIRPFLWQRGLSLYYRDRFAEGAAQFRDDVAVNPNDTEESIWAFLCESALQGPEAARRSMLQVGRDSRPVMRAAYECFRTGADPSMITDAAAASDPSAGAPFYAQLYVGLYREAHGDAGAACEALRAALATPYAARSGDYMVDVARVHVATRGWAIET